MIDGPTRPTGVRGFIEQLRGFERVRSGVGTYEPLSPAAVDAAELGAFLTDLKDESERYLTVDPRVSLRLAESLVYVAGLVDQPEHGAFGLTAMGDALRALGRYEEARGSLIEAGRIFQIRQNEVGWARTQIGLLFVSRFLNSAIGALDEVARALEILTRHEEWLRAAGLCLNAGLVSGELGDYAGALQFDEMALEFYRRAAAANRSLQPAVEVRSAKARSNQALIFTLQGDFRSALTLLQQARDVFLHYDETLLVFGQDKHIADVYAGQGYYTRALRVYGDTFAAYEKAGLTMDASLVALNRVECYLRLNYYDEALRLAQDTIARFELGGSPSEAAKARVYAAVAWIGRGEYAQALELLTDAARAFEASGLSGYVGVAVLHLAGLGLARKDWVGACAEAERAERLFAERHMVVYQARSQMVRARALLGRERQGEAVLLANAVLAVARDRDLAWLAQEGHHVLAQAARHAGRTDVALNEYDAAIASIERVQGALAAELRTRFLGDKLTVYHDAIDLCLERGQPELAFNYLERAKSRALVDYLAGHAEVRPRSTDNSKPELRHELARLREEHNWLSIRLLGSGLARLPLGRQIDADEPSIADAGELRATIQDREHRIELLLEQLSLDRAELAAPDQVELAQRSGDASNPPILESGTVLFEYYFRAETGAIFVVANGRIAVVPLTARPSDIRRIISQWQLNLSATARSIVDGETLDRLGRNARALLAALWEALIQPAESYLTNCKQLVVIPYGVTHAVPFSALIDRSGYLIQGMEVSICPSSRLLELCRGRPRSARDHALVVGHSNGGRLPGVVAEARAVAELLPGECYLENAATRAALVDVASRYGVIHLAAHGEARLDNPTFAHLQLADGQLGVVDVFGLDLRGALVTLSACESGQAVVAGGDELVGLSRGFLYAGAATLVQSLWRVEDRSTAELMVSFYRALRSGLSAGAALREAQSAQLEQRRNHPYFWAAFQLVGASGHEAHGGVDRCRQI